MYGSDPGTLDCHLFYGTVSSLDRPPSSSRRPSSPGAPSRRSPSVCPECRVETSHGRRPEPSSVRWRGRSQNRRCFLPLFESECLDDDLPYSVLLSSRGRPWGTSRKVLAPRFSSVEVGPRSCPVNVPGLDVYPLRRETPVSTSVSGRGPRGSWCSGVVL